MFSLEGKHVAVIGAGLSGRAAASLLLRRGARVHLVDAGSDPALEQAVATLRAEGAAVDLGAKGWPPGDFDLGILSPGVPTRSRVAREGEARGVPMIGEFELGYQQSLCLNVAITGTNGKTTTTELVARVLAHAGRRTLAAGNIGVPVCSVADRTRELDFLTLEVSSFQLETIRFFRPAVAVFTNLTPDHMDRYSGMADYARAKARVFENQQSFDWAVVQSEALAFLRTLGIEPAAKVITYSASNRQADLYLDRGLLLSRLPDWTGPLFNMETSALRGPHNAENIMAALAVGRILRIPLDQITEAIQGYRPAPHRCEWLGEHRGVAFVNDSKATNLDAVAKAVMSMPATRGGDANVWLIAGGQDKGFDFHDIGPLLSRRVKGAFLLGETREKVRAAWSLFTPCSLVGSLLEAVDQAAESAVAGDVVLLSPACSSFDMFQNYQHRGEVFRQAVRRWMEASGGTLGENPGCTAHEPSPQPSDPATNTDLK
jgi:UDP-N-acetylmuramoylalanine--D-glutamate ligase